MLKGDNHNGSTDQIKQLISLISKLPGLGQRSARRAVLHMINRPDALMRPISDVMYEVQNKVQKCELCGNISMNPECDICQDPKRETDKLCVVAEVSDLWAMERSNTFKGRFFVLGGLLSAIDGIDPNSLGIPKLLNRVSSQNISEVILALSATVNGQTTAFYLADQLTTQNVEVTVLAHGVPVGGELEYLDEGTLDIAFKSRRRI